MNDQVQQRVALKEDVPIAKNAKPASQEELEGLQDVLKTFAAAPVVLKYLQADSFIVGFSEKEDGVVFHFYPPRSMAVDMVSEAKRRGYILHDRFGQVIADEWQKLFANKRCRLEMLKEEVAGIESFGVGSDSWCLRAEGYGLSPDEAKMFSALLTSINEELKPLLKIMLG